VIRPQSAVTRRRVLCVLVGLPAASCAHAALAHAFLVKSSPSVRSTVPEGPVRVALWFSERLEPAYSTVSVWTANGMQVDQRDAVVDPDGRKRLSVGLVPLAAGRYTVRYRVLSVDGHVVESSYVFTVGARGRQR
jgi:methionine-rich copper-binding protein CopC